jgi:hypothetical protein
VGRVIWNRSTWVKDPDSGRRTRRERPESEWSVGGCPALVGDDVWARVQQRCRECPTGQRVGRPRRYLLSWLLICEQCGARLVVTSTPARYACGTYLYGGRAAYRMRLVFDCLPQTQCQVGGGEDFLGGLAEDGVRQVTGVGVREIARQGCEQSAQETHRTVLSMRIVPVDAVVHVMSLPGFEWKSISWVT